MWLPSNVHAMGTQATGVTFYFSQHTLSLLLPLQAPGTSWAHLSAWVNFPFPPTMASWFTPSPLHRGSLPCPGPILSLHSPNSTTHSSFPVFVTVTIVINLRYSLMNSIFPEGLVTPCLACSKHPINIYWLNEEKWPHHPPTLLSRLFWTLKVFGF